MEKYTTEHIEQYLENTLSESERIIMEQELAASPELQEEVKLQQVVVKKLHRQALKSLILEAHIRNTGNGRSFYKWFFGAVLMAALLTGTYFLVPEKEDTQNKKQATVAVIPDAEKKEAEVRKHVDVPYTIYNFQAEKGITVKDKRSGAVITIPANALQNKDGQPVKGKVSLKYREFRTKADFALAGIPMTYKDKNFNSAGMFELHSFQNEDTLQLVNGKKAGIKFNMTKDEPGIGFYYLSQPENVWVLLQPLDNKSTRGIDSEESALYEDLFSDTSEADSPAEPIEKFAGTDGKERFVNGLNYQITKSGVKDNIHLPEQAEINEFVQKGKTQVPVQRKLQSRFKTMEMQADTIDTRKIQENYTSNLDDLKASVDDKKGYNEENAYQAARLIMTKEELQMSKDEWYAYIKGNKEVQKRIKMHMDSVAFLGQDAPKYIQGLVQKTNNILIRIRQEEYDKAQAKSDSINRSAVDRGLLDAGHYYDPLVRDLTISGFGVYNCDQVYLIKSPVTIEAVYTDEQGLPISSLRALSVIDPRVNGAFSFAPHTFTCSSYGSTNLLLFTKDNRIFFLDKQGWNEVRIKKSGKYTFKMKEITRQVKTPEELQAIFENQSSI